MLNRAPAEDDLVILLTWGVSKIWDTLKQAKFGTYSGHFWEGFAIFVTSVNLTEVTIEWLEFSFFSLLFFTHLVNLAVNHSRPHLKPLQLEKSPVKLQVSNWF